MDTKKKQSLLNAVARLLEERGTLTADEAMKDAGCDTLRQHIWRLREQGWKISTRVERRTVYVLEGKPEEKS
ncbi:MAG: hypothetical protein IJS89_04805 [Bacteroidaceae bacterium]|nr:hypothetical protein [Bacteroidaceae bacterium]